MSNEVMRTPEMLAAEINLIKDQTRKLVLTNSIIIGQKLTEARRMMDHGQFGKWLAAVDFSSSTANNLMRVYEEYGSDQGVLFGSAAKSQALEGLSYTQAVLLLGVAREEREAFVEKENVEEISTRELKAKVEEYKKAKEAAEKTANAATDKVRCLENKLAENEEQAKKLSQEATISKNAAATAKEKMAKLRDKLKDANAHIDMLKDNGVKLEQMVAEKSSLEKRIKELEEELAQPVTMEAAKEIVERVPEEVQAELEELRRKVAENAAALETEKVKLAFKAKFKSGQETINNLLDEISGCEDNGLRAGMYRALQAVLENTAAVVRERLEIGGGGNEPE